MSISTVVALKFLIVWGFIFWYTRRQSQNLEKEVAEAKARQAAEALGEERRG
jgi:hypothetical protein